MLIQPSRLCPCCDSTVSSWCLCMYLGQNANGDAGSTSGRPCQRMVAMATAAAAQCDIVCVTLGQIRSVRRTVWSRTMRLRDTSGCELREFVIFVFRVLSFLTWKSWIWRAKRQIFTSESRLNLKAPLSKAYVTVLIHRLLTMTKPSRSSAVIGR